VEESPSSAIDDALRLEVFAAAVRIVESIHYANAGTIEFLVDCQSRRFYFIEMNTRLQVEHPVTEMVTGVDLVREQLLFAQTRKLSLRQDNLRSSGHSIECRVNAEDASNGFMPSPGRIAEFVPPSGPGVRVDTFCTGGSTVPPFYDSMIAKVIVHAPDRSQAIARMSAALAAFRISGIKTTIPFHRQLMKHERFTTGQFNTRWIDSGALAPLTGG
jgi:acetyl-CoA carboxylase biotin carboxylase subunit